MAIEAHENPWLYPGTVIEKGGQVWFCRNPVAWTDVQRNAQNQADQTGRIQYLILGDGHLITHEVTPDERRSAALHQ
jgi:hypothetical protein